MFHRSAGILLLAALLIGALFISLHAYGTMHTPDTLKTIMDGYGVSMPSAGEYELLKENSTAYGAAELRTAVAGDGRDTIRLSILSGLTEEDAMSYIDSQGYMIENLFEQSFSPYPGQISNSFRCPEEYHPVTEEHEDGHSFRRFYYLYANGRLAFGGCSDDLLEFLSAVGIIYCRDNGSVFHIELFTPRDNPTPGYREIVESFQCG